MKVIKLYKREEGGGSKGSTVSVTLRRRISDLTHLLVRSWDFPARIGVVARPCEASWEARHTIWIVCGPFAARGDKGEAEYP